MVIVDVSNKDYTKYTEIFRIAYGLFGWTKEDSIVVNVDNKEFVVFGYHPIFMMFGYDKNGNLISKSCVVDENNKVISVIVDGYQVNMSDNMIYLIDEDGRHQSLQVLKNNDDPYFELASNGLLTYMQYDSKKDVRLITRYDYNVYGTDSVIYSTYLKEPFYYSIESSPVKRDKGLFFVGKKDAYYRLDFDIWNNKWQYDLATIGEYGVNAVLANDTITLHGGEKEFSRYYKVLFSVNDYLSFTTFPLGKAYLKSDIDSLIGNLKFNKCIPNNVVDIFNNRNNIVKEFQLVVDTINGNEVKYVKK